MRINAGDRLVVQVRIRIYTNSSKISNLPAFDWDRPGEWICGQLETMWNSLGW
jgi:hypothetical protein